MGIKSVSPIKACNKAFYSKDEKNSKDSFYNKLKKTINTNEDENILEEINSEPTEDKEEDLLLYRVLKKDGFKLKGHSFSWVRENCNLVIFPPITAPGHLRKQFKDYISTLNLKDKEKNDIGFSIVAQYALYIKENPKETMKAYSNEAMSKLILNLLEYNEKYKKRTSKHVNV